MDFSKQSNCWTRVFKHINIIYYNLKLSVGDYIFVELQSQSKVTLCDFGPLGWNEPDVSHWITVQVSFGGGCFCGRTDLLSVRPSVLVSPLPALLTLDLSWPHSAEARNSINRSSMIAGKCIYGQATSGFTARPSNFKKVVSQTADAKMLSVRIE